MADSPLTFPVPLPVILNKQGDDDRGTPMPVRVTNLPDSDIQEEQLETSSSMLGFFQQFWNKEKKFQNLDKLNLKIAQAWDKFGIAKFAGGMIKGLKSVVSGLTGLGMGFFGMLTGLLAFAFLDPSGGFLASVIGMFANFLVMFIDVIAKLIPRLIPIIVKIIPILIKAFGKILESISKMIPVIIEALVKGLPLLYEALKKAVPMLVTNIMDAIINTMKLIKDKIPFLEPILSFIEKTGEGIKKIFDPNDGDVKTRLQAFAKETFTNFMTAMRDQFQNTRSLANETFGEKNVRALEATMILYGALSVIIGGLVGILGVVNFLLGIKKTLLLAESLGLITANAGLAGMAAALWTLIAPMLPFILLAVALVAAFALLYVYWDEVVEFLGKAWEWLKDSTIKGFNALIEWVPKAFDSLVKSLKDVFNWIGDIFWDFVGLLMIPVNFIFDGIIFLYKQFIKIKDKFYSAMQGIVKIFSDLFGKIKNIFEGKLDIGASIANAVRSAFSNIPGMDRIKSWFNELLDTIQDSDVFKWLSKAKKFVTGESDTASIKTMVTSKLSGKLSKVSEGALGNVIDTYFKSGGKSDLKSLASSSGLKDADIKTITDTIASTAKELKITVDSNISTENMERLLQKLIDKEPFKQAVGYQAPQTQEKSFFDKLNPFKS